MQDNPGDNWYNALLLFKYFSKINTALSKKADQIIEQFFLEDVTDSLAGEISYGQQKLLTLTACVFNGASLLLIDKAVDEVQPEYRNKISGILKDLRNQSKQY